MKNLHPARRRLLIGGLLLAATFFYAFASTCGLLGRGIAYASAQLIGQTGSTLVAMCMLGSALAFLIPHGAPGRFIAWVMHGREARVARVVREMDAYERRRVLDVVTVPGDTALPSTTGERLAERGRRDRDGVQSPADRMKLDTVREALRGLGYKKDEYGPLVTKMDPKVDFEILVKGALAELRGAEAN